MAFDWCALELLTCIFEKVMDALSFFFDDYQILKILKIWTFFFKNRKLSFCLILKCFEYIENLRGLKKRGVRGGGTLAIKIDLCPIFRLHCLPPTSFLAQNFGFYF